MRRLTVYVLVAAIVTVVVASAAAGIGYYEAERWPSPAATQRFF